MTSTTDSTDMIHPTQGWAHKALFGGIVLGVAVVVGFGILLYDSTMPVRTDGVGSASHNRSSIVSTRLES